MSDWKSLLKERFTTKDGRVEELHILQGPTYPCEFYAGPILERYRKGKPRRGGRYAGRLRLSVVPDRAGPTLCGFVKSAVDPATEMVVTDAWQGYAGLVKLGYQHLACPERGEPNVAEDYLPIVHLIFSNLKAWLNGVHHGVSPKHLQAYLNEFVFRFNRRFYPFNAFRSLLGLSTSIRY